MRSHSLGELFGQNDQTNSLISHANFLLELRRIIVLVLPAEIARNCSIANYKDGKLVIFADNNAVAAKLRLLAGGLPLKISGHLQQTGRQVTAVAIEVQPRAPAPGTVQKSTRISPRGGEEILALSTQVTDNKLKDILISLASRATK
jgi:hypothetical protein